MIAHGAWALARRCAFAIAQAADDAACNRVRVRISDSTFAIAESYRLSVWNPPPYRHEYEPEPIDPYELAQAEEFWSERAAAAGNDEESLRERRI